MRRTGISARGERKRERERERAAEQGKVKFCLCMAGRLVGE